MSTPTLPSLTHPTRTSPPRSTIGPAVSIDAYLDADAPCTVRCATEHPRYFPAPHARHDERSALASIKCNIDFLQAVLGSSASALALDALADLATAVARLETRVRPAYTLLPPRGHR